MKKNGERFYPILIWKLQTSAKTAIIFGRNKIPRSFGVV